jgi:hypothetical protein
MPRGEKAADADLGGGRHAGSLTGLMTDPATPLSTLKAGIWPETSVA